MAQYDGWEASSDYEEEADDTMVVPNHNQAIPAINNTIPTAGLRPNQAGGKTNPRGASAGSLYASSNTPAVSGQPPCKSFPPRFFLLFVRALLTCNSLRRYCTTSPRHHPEWSSSSDFHWCRCYSVLRCRVVLSSSACSPWP